MFTHACVCAMCKHADRRTDNGDFIDLSDFKVEKPKMNFVQCNMRTLYKQLMSNLLGELVLNTDYTGHWSGSSPPAADFLRVKTQT